MVWVPVREAKPDEREAGFLSVPQTLELEEFTVEHACRLVMRFKQGRPASALRTVLLAFPPAVSSVLTRAATQEVNCVHRWQDSHDSEPPVASSIPSRNLLQTGEWDKLFGRLNSFANIVVLSGHRHPGV